MVWGKRTFGGIEYVPYFDLVERLLLANGALYREFIMVSTKTDKPLVADFYVGVPNEMFLAMFEGLERIEEGDLPKSSTRCTLPTQLRNSSNRAFDSPTLGEPAT